MNLFKSLPAVVALFFAIISLVVTVVLTLWPVLATYVPITAAPMIGLFIAILLIILHYEKMLKDLAAVAAGKAPLSTLADDIKAALNEGFGNVITQLVAQAKADVAAQPAASALTTVTAAVAAVSELTQGVQAVGASLTENQGQ